MVRVNAFSLFCLASIVGIWPRFIEPYLLKITHLNIPLVKGRFKLVQISDLHFNEEICPQFLDKIVGKVNREKPDLIAITGDFICNGHLYDPKIIKEFLKKLKAPLGIFAVLGNHDFNVPLNINEAGEYDATITPASPFLSGLKRLFRKPALTGKVTARAKAAIPHQQLLEVLVESNVTLLNNRTQQVGPINLTGLGEYMACDTSPEAGFSTYDKNLPGVVLVHNPDAVKQLEPYPGRLILSGHLHGGQINLPLLWKRFTATENRAFKAGLYSLEDKHLYISRGIGGIIPFRFNAFPEVVSLSLGGIE